MEESRRSRLPPGFEPFPGAILDSLREAVLVYDDEARLRFVNRRVSELTGYTPAEILGRPIPEIFLRPEERGAFAERFAARRRGVAETYEARITRKDGSLFWAEVDARPRHDANGSFLGVLVTATDISDRKAAEEARRQGEERFRRLAETASDGILTSGGQRLFTGFVRDVRDRKRFQEALAQSNALLSSLIEAAPLPVITIDPAGTVRRWNRAAEGMFGWSAEEIVGRRYPLASPEKQPEYDAIVADSLAGRQRVAFETQRRRKDGSLIDVAISTAAVRGPGGQIAELVGIFEDISERKQAEQALRASEERYHDLVIHIPDVVWMSDAEGNSLYVSPNVERVYGFGAAEVIAAGPALWFDRIHPDDAARVRETYARFIAGEGAFDLDYRIQRKDGRWIWIHDRAVNRVEGEDRIWVYGVFRDVTDRHRAAELLRASREELRDLNERLRALSVRLLQIREDERATIAREIHDRLGQALTGLRLQLAALRRTPPQDPAGLATRVTAMLEILDATLAMVRELSTELRPIVLDSLGLTAAVEWQVQEIAKRSRLRTELKLQIQHLWPRRELATAVFRCLQEALTNVERHAQASAVAVSLAEEQGRLVLEVRDDGRGIRPTEIHGLSSLGLLGMRERAAALGGELTLEGEPTRGTVVRVEIPLRTEDRIEGSA